MSRHVTAARPLLHTSRRAVTFNWASPAPRCLSQTAARRDDSFKNSPPPTTSSSTHPSSRSLLDSIYGASNASSGNTASGAMASLSRGGGSSSPGSSIIDTSVLSGGFTAGAPAREDALEPYHFHIYAHKHNTHITVTKPNRNPIISMSCGNIGYKKSRRRGFDSAYSLTKYVIERLVHTGWPIKIHRLEIVLRGFGQGREAAVKVLLGPDAKVFREKIVRVSDSTRIKFAGTRSKRPRRL